VLQYTVVRRVGAKPAYQMVAERQIVGDGRSAEVPNTVGTFRCKQPIQVPLRTKPVYLAQITLIVQIFMMSTSG